MEALLLVTVVLLLSACYGVVTLALLINLGVLPRPEENQLAARLYWRKDVQFVASLPMIFNVTYTGSSTGGVPRVHNGRVWAATGTDGSILLPAWAAQGGVALALIVATMGGALGSHVSGAAVPGETIYIKVG